MLRLARPHHRSGFTLVEILVAIGIIITLAAILVVALGNSGVRAREEATATLIRKVSNQVQERLEALDRLRSQPQWAKDAQGKYSSSGLTSQQAGVLYLKDVMKWQFPQRFDDLTSTELSEQIQSNAQYPYDASKASMGDPSGETESSELLYYFLTRGRVLGIPTVDPGEYKASEVADTDGDGLLEFIDAWGKPLRFYRWPTRLIRAGEDINGNGSLDGDEDANGNSTLDGPGNNSPIIRKWASVLISGLPAVASPDSLAKDQDDPTLLLSMISNFNETNYHTPQTYHVFLIVSAGADGQKAGLGSMDDAFGLYKPTDTTHFGHLCQPIGGKFDALTDNITNRNR